MNDFGLESFIQTKLETDRRNLAAAGLAIKDEPNRRARYFLDFWLGVVEARNPYFPHGAQCTNWIQPGQDGSIGFPYSNSTNEYVGFYLGYEASTSIASPPWCEESLLLTVDLLKHLSLRSDDGDILLELRARNVSLNVVVFEEPVVFKDMPGVHSPDFKPLPLDSTLLQQGYTSRTGTSLFRELKLLNPAKQVKRYYWVR